MNEPEICRLQEDLDTIRQAAGVDLPFNHRDVWILTPLACVTGATIASIGWWAPRQYMWTALLPTAIFLAAWFGLVRSAHREKAVKPVRWREARYGLLSLFVIAPFFVAFIAWHSVIGTPRGAGAAAATFFMGLGLSWFAIIDRTRRHYVGTAIPMMIFGLAIPSLSPQAIRAGAGVMVIAIGVATGAIQLWQLRCQRGNTDAG